MVAGISKYAKCISQNFDNNHGHVCENMFLMIFFSNIRSNCPVYAVFFQHVWQNISWMLNVEAVAHKLFIGSVFLLEK